jgi:predicted secreted hydrolase
MISLFTFGMLPACLAAVPLETAEGFKVPQPGAPLAFPDAHGAHPGFKIEWWYVTGHLYADSGERFGYQATFFRSGLRPAAQQQETSFGDAQVYLTHMAISDVSGEQFLFEERLSRDGWDAWSRTGTIDLRNGNWTLKAVAPDVGKIRLQASVRSEASWTLDLEPEKRLVRFGPDGTSRKGPGPDARSYYLSFTRLRTSGTLTIADKTYTVTGSSWMDHEIASNQLDPSYTGWDWIAIQLGDGWEVKAYLLRQADGSPSPYSALIWIDPEGKLTYRGPESFTWDKSRQWQSPVTGAAYPIAPVIKTTHPSTGEQATFRFSPILQDQELALPGTTYWEGAGRVFDAAGRETGSAYLELVGYAGDITGLR